MAVEPAAPAATGRTHPTVFVDTFTNGLLGPDVEMLGPVEDGGHVVVNTTPGCWGPMITPALRGGRARSRSRWRSRVRSRATRSRSASRTSRSPR